MILFVASHSIHSLSTLPLPALLCCLGSSTQSPVLTLHYHNGPSCSEPLACPLHLHMVFWSSLDQLFTSWALCTYVLAISSLRLSCLAQHSLWSNHMFISHENFIGPSKFVTQLLRACLVHSSMLPHRPYSWRASGSWLHIAACLARHSFLYGLCSSLRQMCGEQFCHHTLGEPHFRCGKLTAQIKCALKPNPRLSTTNYFN
jgi:hypothetical protein